MFLHTVGCYSETIPLRKCAHYYFYLMKELKRQSLSLRQLRTAFFVAKVGSKAGQIQILRTGKSCSKKKMFTFQIPPYALAWLKDISRTPYILETQTF